MTKKEKREKKTSPEVPVAVLFVALALIAVLDHAYYRNNLDNVVTPVTTSNITPIEFLHPEFEVTRISPVERRITRNTLNLRRGPGISYEKIGSVPSSTVLQITGVSGDWYLAQLNGREFFVAGWLTYDLPTATPAVRIAPRPTISVQRFTSPLRKYTHGKLNIRSGPGTAYRRVGQFGAGGVVVALGRSGDWYLIKRNGRDAYVASWLTYDSPPPRQRVSLLAQQRPAQLQPAPQQQSYTCNCRKTCSEMSSCNEAYYQLRNCRCGRRDGDNDGVPCENICG